MAYITQRAQHPAIKFLKFISIVSLILAVAGGYLYMHPAVWQKWVKGTPLEPPPATTHVYKWQGANGQWQITDTPPPAGTKFEQLDYRSDTNIMPPLVPQEDD